MIKTLKRATIICLLSTQIGLANTKICEIKYGENGLEKNKVVNAFTRILNNQNTQKCHQIGFEFNEFGEELPNKPIYACCSPE